MESFTLSALIPAPAKQVYEAWLSAEGHSLMTGTQAEIEAGIGGAFTAWDGYISGKTLELQPYRRIVQTWRTSEFPEDSPDSHVEILLQEAAEGTKLTLVHTHIPAGQAEGYKKGWQDFYFTPMRAFFSK